MGAKRVVDREVAFAIQYVMRILPFRMVSIHYCYDDVRFRVMMTFAMLMMGATRRVRLRAHYGNYKDVLYKLATFGIPSSALPIAHDGEPKNKSHKAWLKQRNLQELNQGMGILPQGIVVVPSRCDVLLGRGKPVQGRTDTGTVTQEGTTSLLFYFLRFLSFVDHFGNIRYLALLDHFQDAYDRSLKFQMMKICETILGIVAEYGGRFLKQEGAGWVEVDAATAREKVGHGFRTRRASMVKKVKGDNALSREVPSCHDVSHYEVSMGEKPSSRTMDSKKSSSRRMGSKEMAVILTDVDQDSSDDSMNSTGNGKRLRLWDEIFPN